MTYEDNHAPTYPNNGNLVSDYNVSATLNALNQPIWMTSTARTRNLQFAHDPLGRCVKRWDKGGATYLYYDGWNLIEEGTSFSQPARQYVHGARVDEIVLSWVNASAQGVYHHYDARTHCIMLTGQGQNIIEQYDYDAFGRVYAYDSAGTALTVNGRPGSPFGNRFLFTGREWLWDLGVYDYRHRHYNPELGRFLQPDSLHFSGKDLNLYRYCHNDPVNRLDPFGLIDWKSVDAYIAAGGKGDVKTTTGRVLDPRDISLVVDKDRKANCFGQVFANGKINIDARSAALIAKDDYHAELNTKALIPGSVAVWGKEGWTHSAKVVSNDRDPLVDDNHMVSTNVTTPGRGPASQADRGSGLLGDWGPKPVEKYLSPNDPGNVRESRPISVQNDRWEISR